MTFGISVLLNELNEIVIDSDNYLLRATTISTAARATVARPAGANPNAWHADYPSNVHRYLIPIGSVTTQPVLLIKWPIGLEIFSLGKIGNNIEIYAPYADGPANLEYALCSYDPPPLPTGGYGILISDGNGAPVFSSQEMNVKVKNIFTEGPTSTFSGNPPAPTHNPLLIHNFPNLYISPVHLWETGQTFGNGAGFGGGVRISGSEIRRANMMFTDQAPIVFGNPGVLSCLI